MRMGELSRFTQGAGGRQESRALHPFPGAAGPGLVQNQSHHHITYLLLKIKLKKKKKGQKLFTWKNESWDSLNRRM